MNRSVHDEASAALFHMNLLERTSQLETLMMLLQRVSFTGGELVFLGGEAGVGKTALVQAFCAQASETAQVLVGACDALSTPRPLGPLLDIAHEAGGELAQLAFSDAPRPHLFHAALTTLAAAERVVFVIEDAHWADEATLDLLRYLGRRVDATHALVLVTYRDDEVGPTHPLRSAMGDLATATRLHRIVLNPLSAGAVQTLARDSSIDAASLYRRTGGNPFFVTELLASDAQGISATVQDAVLARVTRLSPPARTLLDAVAIIGARVEPWLLEAIADADPAAVDECLSSGMLQTARDLLMFRHELAREAVLATIPPRRSRMLHAATLAALQSMTSGGTHLARLAHHAEAAGDCAAVLAYAPPAARQAETLHANREASAQYARALRCAGSLDDQARLALLEAYARVADLAAWGIGGLRPRLEMIAVARRLGDRCAMAEHLGWSSVALALDSQHVQARLAALEALSCLEGLPEGVAHASVYGHVAHLSMLSGNLSDAVAWGERAVALAEQIGDRERMLLGLNTLGQAWLQHDDLERGRAALEQGLRIAHDADLPGFIAAAQANLGDGHVLAYRFHEADRYLGDGIAYTIDRDLDIWHWDMVARLALTRHYQGRWTEATELAASILRIPAASVSDLRAPQGLSWEATACTCGVPLYVRAVALLGLGRVRARRGDPGVWEALDESLALTTPGGTFLRLGPIYAARAEAAWLEGDPERTQHEAQAGLACTVGPRSGMIRDELAFWLWRTDALTAEPTGPASPFSRQMRGDWAGAAAAWNALGCPYEAARALADSHDEAALRSALATFEQLDARQAAQHVKRHLQVMGARVIPRGPRPATRDHLAKLTPREAEVLALVAAGNTNSEVAALLFVSPKTVEHHVSAIFSKLGTRTRGETVRKAREIGALSPI